jgi:hypothetical protein
MRVIILVARVCALAQIIITNAGKLAEFLELTRD